MALIDGLVEYWKLDEASGNRAGSHGGNTLTDNGSVPGAAGKIGNGADFEKTGAPNHRLTSTDTAALSMGDIDFTFTVWVHAETLVDLPPILGKWFTGGSGHLEYSLTYSDSADRFRLRVSNDGSAITGLNWSSPPSVSTWYFIVIWHDATNDQIGMMVNNATAVTAAHAGGVFDGTSTFEVGGNAGGTVYWDGLIDEIGLWKRLLTVQEKTTLYNGGAGLAYPFNVGVPIIGHTVLDYAD